MPKHFVYITSKPDRKSYSLRYRTNFKEYEEDLELMRRVGHQMVKSFVVSHELVSLALEACSEFINGRISLKDLEE
ncbi:MAG: hypothetical protein QXD13_02165, partial [Candidatus Pacearchaeota archaeon]